MCQLSFGSLFWSLFVLFHLLKTLFGSDLELVSSSLLFVLYRLKLLHCLFLSSGYVIRIIATNRNMHAQPPLEGDGFTKPKENRREETVIS